jgi:hypothetical protein
MRKRTTIRLLAIALALAVVGLSTDAACHWHAQAYGEQHCQVCHIGHAAVPQSASQASVQALVPISRFAHSEVLAPYLVSVSTPSIPRAPPA